MSVVVVFITALVAVYLLRYEAVFVIALLVVKSAFLLLTEECLLSHHPGKSKEGSLDITEKSCRLWEWALAGDYGLKLFALCSFKTFSIKLGMCKWL